jgi:hypothetical protein
VNTCRVGLSRVRSPADRVCHDRNKPPSHPHYRNTTDRYSATRTVSCQCLSVIESIQRVTHSLTTPANRDIVRLIRLLTIDERAEELICTRRVADDWPAGVHDAAVTVRNIHRVILLSDHKTLIVDDSDNTRFADWLMMIDLSIYTTYTANDHRLYRPTRCPWRP